LPFAGARYVLLAALPGYTSFLNGVERDHGVDFSAGLPAGYEVLGALLGAVIERGPPEFELANLGGVAVFAVAPADALEPQGQAVLDRFRAAYREFAVVREDRK